MSAWSQRLARTFAARMPDRDRPTRALGREGEHPVVHPDGRLADITPLWPALCEGALEVQREGDLIVGAVHARVTFVAEVGRGTLEIIVGPCADLHEVRSDYEAGMARVLAAASAEGLVVLGYGIQPVAGPDPRWMTPKQRYAVLRDTIGASWDWFALTASDQLHVDVRPDEVVAATNLANLLSPVTIALCANSPISGGAPSGACSTRERQMGRIQAEGYRHGMTRRPVADLAQWVEDTLDLTFLMAKDAEGRSHPYGASFRTWLEAHAPDDDDAFEAWLWHEHYIWNSARPRCAHGTVELRSPCQQPWGSHMAAAALGTGMIEAHEALWAFVHETLGADAWSIMRRWHDDVTEGGLDVAEPAPGFLRGVLDLVRAGLEARGRDEAAYLDALDARLARRRNPAQEALAVFEAAGMPGLVAHAGIA